MSKEMYAVFKGVVQGVGFRYTALKIARRYSLGGWVRNRLDGAVEMVIQGDKTDMEKLVEDLKVQFGGYIQSYDVDYRDQKEIFPDFSIRF